MVKATLLTGAGGTPVSLLLSYLYPLLPLPFPNPYFTASALFFANYVGVLLEAVDETVLDDTAESDLFLSS